MHLLEQHMGLPEPCSTPGTVSLVSDGDQGDKKWPGIPEEGQQVVLMKTRVAAGAHLHEDRCHATGPLPGWRWVGVRGAAGAFCQGRSWAEPQVWEFQQELQVG